MKSFAPRILLSAFACDPRMGSEPYVGWKWLEILAGFGSVTVLTRVQHRDAIKAALDTKPVNDVEVLAFDIFGCKNIDHRARYIKLYYIVWQLSAFFVVLLSHARNRYDIVHHITYNVMDFCGVLWALPNTKFIWGPVGGGQVPPEMAAKLYGAAWKRERRRAVLKAHARFNPFLRLTVRYAQAILFANLETERRFADLNVVRRRLLMETAIDPPIAPQPRSLPVKKRSFRLLWIGQIEPRKGVDLFLDVVQSLVDNFDGLDVCADIVGSGPDFEMVSRRVNANTALQGRVVLHGSVAFDRVKVYYREADLFVFTSMQDTSGNVVLEALREGIPVIAPNHQGAALILANGGGLLFDVSSYDAAVWEMCRQIAGILGSPDMYANMSKDAIDNILYHNNWIKRAGAMRELYDEIQFHTACDRSAAKT